MKYILEHKTATKLQIVLKGKFRKFHPETGREEFEEITIASKNQIILREDEIEETIHALLLEIHEKIESWDNNEGYWHLVNVVNIDFKLREYKPLSGSSCIKLPKWIYNKKATINIKNEDQKCFKYCLQYHKHKNEITHHPERVSWYSNWNNDYDFSNIKFPVEVDDIKKFFKQNNIPINVYIVNGKSIQHYLTCSQDERKSDHVNLLLIEDEARSHYVYIKCLSKLVRDQLTKHKNDHFICERCFYHTENIEVFKRHQIQCDNYFDNEKAIPILPKVEDNILKFKNEHKTIKVLLVYYADLEAVLRKLDHKRLKARHEACSYSFLGVSSFYNNLKKYTSTSAKDTMNNFVQTLIEEGRKLNELLLKRLEEFKKPRLNNDDLLKFEKAEQCHFCKKAFTETNIKVRDHCHITGKFRGAAHQSCNLNVRTSLKIPVFFHNGSGYDFKHFIRKLYKIDRNIKIISQTQEKYFSITARVEGTNIQFEFKESLKFLLKSIDKSAKVLYDKDKAGIKNFKNLTSYFHNTPNEILELPVQKGVFPYIYLDSFDKLKFTEYPNYESFYDNLKDKNIELKEYKRRKKLWNYFKCKCFREYMELYLPCDVLILADCFEEFRDLSLKHYGLDPAQVLDYLGMQC
jgi:hypothetical protein